MKKLIVTGLAVFFIGSFVSCKKEKTDEGENTEMTTDGTMATDTMATDEVMTANDSNVSGVTGGEMEQVP